VEENASKENKSEFLSHTVFLQYFGAKANNFTAKKKNRKTTLTLWLLAFSQSNVFTSLITKPTSISNTSETVIDHTFTNDSQSTISSRVFSYSLSDHYPIFCTIKNSLFSHPKNNKPYTYRKISSIDAEQFRMDLESSLLPWYETFIQSPTNDMNQTNFDKHFEDFMKTFRLVIDKHAPVVKASRKQKRILQNPWLTKGLLVSIKWKQKLHQTCKSHRNPLDISFYKRYSNKLTRLKNSRNNWIMKT